MPLPFPALLTSVNGCQSHSVQGKHNRRVVFQKYFNLEEIVVEISTCFSGFAAFAWLWSPDASGTLE